MNTYLHLTVRYYLFLAQSLVVLLFSSSASALLMRENGPEPVIVQIKESLRLSDDLDNRLSQLEAAHSQNGLSVQKWWAGNKLLVMLSFPSNFTEQHALAVIAALNQLPAVEKVVAVSAFNLEFKPGDFVRAYVSNQTIPEAARRGLDREELRHSAMTPAQIDEAAQMPHVPNQLIVRWKSRYVWRATAAGFLQSIANFHAAGGAHVIREMRSSLTDLTQVIEIDDLVTPFANKLRRYAECPWVDYAQPNFIYEIAAVAPNDPLYNNPGQLNLAKISAPSAWAVTTGTQSLVVAVADTGANINHPDVAPNLSPGWRNFAGGDPNDVTDTDPCVPYHGSHVASIIGAKGNNGQFMTGVAWNVSLLILKASAGCGTDSVMFADAINYAWSKVGHAPAIAINISSAIHGKQIDETLQTAVRNAQANNMVVVAAAANDMEDLDLANSERISPACVPTDNVIAVGATRVRPDDPSKDDRKPEYSNWGRYRVELGAPGGDGGSDNCAYGIIGLLPDPNAPAPTCTPGPVGWRRLSGTSFSAPLVTGAIALVKSEYPWEDYLGLRDRVIMGTDDVSTLVDLEGKPLFRSGRLNLYKALQKRTLIKNLSTRARVQGGDQVMIAGFVIGGSSEPCGPDPLPPCLKVAIRGLGPSVGVNPPLVDPVIELHGPAGFVTIINDNWQDDPSAAELVAAGLQPSNTSEAAMIRSLPPGAYTAILRRHDSSNDDGVGLVELYALGNDERFRFKNISTRCIVGTGDEVAIAGTILQNPGAAPFPKRRILSFGRGPSLQRFGLTGTLPDPKIEFHQDQNGMDTIIASNDQWKDIDGTSTGLQDKLVEPNPGFMPLPQAQEQYLNESALWPTLQTGSYTAILKDAHGASGIGLIEFYEY